MVKSLTTVVALVAMYAIAVAVGPGIASVAQLEVAVGSGDCDGDGSRSYVDCDHSGSFPGCDGGIWACGTADDYNTGAGDESCETEDSQCPARHDCEVGDRKGCS